METKEFKIDIPEGYEIDKENSTFECIKFKAIQKRWRDNYKNRIKGFFVTSDSRIGHYEDNNVPYNYNLFATEAQAKSALAMARISQIMANDERFGGAITRNEGANSYMYKWVIRREGDRLMVNCRLSTYHFLAFHREEEARLFLKENEDLVRDFLMIE